MLIHYLPRDSALVTALTDGEPPLSRIENLIADLWALQVKAYSDPGKDSGTVVDHPVRAAITKKAVAAAKKATRALFVKRKSAYARHS